MIEYIKYHPADRKEAESYLVNIPEGSPSLADRGWRLEDSIEARMELGEVRPEFGRAAPDPAPSEGSPPEGTNSE